MKALVYHGPGQKSWEDVPDAVIQEPTDVVVRVDTTTICGTDLHILHGDVAAVTDGRILGHEAVGTVTEAGEAVRVPYADTSLYTVPANVTSEQAIFLADSLPTGYEVGVLAGKVRPGDTVAVVGAGAVGLSAILTTGLWGASRVIAIDSNKFRLDKAMEFGATDTVEASDNTVADVRELVGGTIDSHPAEDGGQRPDPGREDGHPLVHVRPDGRGLRRLQERGRELSPQGRHHPGLIAPSKATAWRVADTRHAGG